MLSETRSASEFTTRLVLPPSLIRKNSPLNRLAITASNRTTMTALSMGVPAVGGWALAGRVPATGTLVTIAKHG